jgi:RimJ/RimL family protein N-acetyltransferase
MAEIETERLLLLRWRDEDLELYAGICADPQVMRNTRSKPRGRNAAEDLLGKRRRSWLSRLFQG